MADRALPEQAPIVEASPPTNEDAATTIEEPMPELEAENDDSDSAYGSIHSSECVLHLVLSQSIATS